MSELEGWTAASSKLLCQATTTSDFDLPGLSCDSTMLIGMREVGKDTLTTAIVGHLVIVIAPGIIEHHNDVIVHPILVISGPSPATHLIFHLFVHNADCEL